MNNNFTLGQDIANTLSGGYSARRLRMLENNVASRIRLILLAFFTIFIFFIGRLFYIATNNNFNRIRTDIENASWDFKRAPIIDRNGELLAVNIPASHLFIQPKQIKDIEKLQTFIRNNFEDITEESLNKAINSKSSYLYLKKNLTTEQIELVKRSKIEGIGIEDNEKRSYPKREIFSHIIGFIGSDGNGLEGVEKWHNDKIKGQTDNFKITLDSRVQSVMYQELTKAVDKFNAKGAIGILMKSGTGEIIAMVSLPDFDPENPNSVSVENRFFKPVQGVYEMGSVFKIFNTSIAIESGMGLKKLYKVDKPITIGGKKISDVATFKPRAPQITVAEIMLNSCNVGSALMAQDFPNGYQQEFLQRLGLFERMETNFGTSAKPLTPRQWGPTEKATVSYGHGISVTPIHIITAINAIVNGGTLIKPTILPANDIESKRVVSPELSKKIRQIMFEIAEKTTARKAKIAGINVGGKTGTANKSIAKGYDTNRVMTVFAGAFPIEAPQYTILVMLDEPQGLPETYGFKTAAWNAVPTAGNVMEVVIPLLF